MIRRELAELDPEVSLTSSKPRAALLIVCSANVCRSPLAEYTLWEAFARVPDFDSVDVASGGTNAMRGQRICDTIRRASEGADWARHNWSDFVDLHRAKRLTPAMVSQAKLILTAGVEHRSAVAKIDARARARTFTIKEALWLGEGFRSDASGTAVLDDFASYAHAERGVKGFPGTRRRLIGRNRGEVDPLSIADGHGERDRVHRATIGEVADLSGRLGVLITGERSQR